MQEEGGASAYTRKNWIAISEDVLNKISAAQLQILVAHELFHILTRYDLNFKKSVYQTIGFTVLDREIIFPTDIMENVSPIRTSAATTAMHPLPLRVQHKTTP